jgi:predicted metal-dependent peptidase
MSTDRSARDRIRQVVEKWFLVEPLLFAVWTTHALTVNPRIRNIRVQQGRVEYNPAFIDALDRRALAEVLVVEAMRILLKHPYARRPDDVELAYAASNLTLQECLETSLPLPRARDVFGHAKFDKQYYEFYYHRLAEHGTTDHTDSADGKTEGQPSEDTGATSADEQIDGPSKASGQDKRDQPHGGGDEAPLDEYVDPSCSGSENAEGWGHDDLFHEQMDDRIRTAMENNAWGTMAGRAKERIVATLRPRLNYRAVLRRFRASVLSSRRRLTRMKPNRRYGFDYMGSRHDFTTRLLFAVDVSGSMSNQDLALGFSVINRFFKYGVEAIDVIQFDTQLQGPALPLKRARRQITVTGRGGTAFTPVIDFLEEQRGYDGAIIFTDGIAPAPAAPKNRRTRLLWLFTSEETHRQQAGGLRPFGLSAFLKGTSSS